MLQRTKILIIGGGLQACALAAQLAYRDQRDFLLVDPSPLLSTWFQGMQSQGLSVLRTPYTAHIGPEGDPASMWRYRDSRRQPTPEDLAQPARVDDFNRYSAMLLERFRLREQQLVGWVTDVTHGGSEFLTRIATAKGEVLVVSDAVVVAVGLGRPVMPDGPNDWRVRHSDSVRVADISANGDTICILGGGLTAGTLAVQYADRGATVHLACRGPVTVSQLEADPDWIPGRRLAEQFLATDSWEERTRQLAAARVGRGVTPEVWIELTSHVDTGNIVLHEGVEVRFWESVRGDRLLVPQIDQEVDQIICATGYRQRIKDVPFMTSLRPELSTTKGLPHVDGHFESEDISGLYFMGKLGELGGGPLSRNVPGARIAAERIADDLDRLRKR